MHISQTSHINKILLTVFLSFSITVAFSQSYLGRITKQVNFREGASKEAAIISSLKRGTQVFIVSLDAVNDFYNIIDIETNLEGYVNKNFIQIGQEVKKDEQGVFTASGETTTYNPDVEVFNNTDIVLNLKLNNEPYIFNPHQKRTLSLSPGDCTYRASAPGVIPKIGTDYLKSNVNYSWEFYIVTDRY